MNNTPFKAPLFNQTSFNCPLCGAFAIQLWHELVGGNRSASHGWTVSLPTSGMRLAHCGHCQKQSLWVDQKMVYPNICIAPRPNKDMPEEIKMDFEEARQIFSGSPRGAAALLRLCVQKLCVHLGEKGKNINDDIAKLVKKGLPEKLQKALDSVRVIGNSAVHPGFIDLNDNPDLAYKLFGFINIIVDIMISKPKEIDEFYDYNLPEDAKAAINRRDGNATN